MIGSQALGIVMSDGLFATINQFLASGGPEVQLGAIAIGVLIMLSVAAALRADMSRKTAQNPALPAPIVVSFASEGRAPQGSVALAKSSSMHSNRKPDSRRRAKPCPAPGQIYRPAYVAILRPQPRLVTRRPVHGQGLNLFIERRGEPARIKGRAK